MKFDELKISNFRGINHAELKEMKQLNLIVGNNNSGKTSILEALFILSGMSNPQLLLNINSQRNFQLSDDDDFKYLFSNLKIDRTIELEGKVSGVKRYLKITPYQGSQMIISSKKNNSSLNQMLTSPFAPPLQSRPVQLENRMKEIDGIKISFKNDGNPEEDLYISLKNESMSFSSSYKEALNARYLSAQILLMSGIIDLSSMVRKKQVKEIVDILKQIEPKLSDIRIMKDNAIYFDIGKDELFPINIMGDGIIRTLSVLSSMYDMSGGVLLLDEIENGLHYSSVKVFWKAVLLLANKLDVQIIATTHSYEALGALVDVKEDLEDMQKNTTPEISLYRIERDNDGDKTKITHYDNDLFMFGINENYEVR